MPNSHNKFHSANGKRLILVADDELINREMMRAILQKDYELLFAGNGREALDLARAYRETLSLVLLDLLMPEISGMDVLQRLKEDPETRQIPVIVITSDQNAEIQSLDLGAADFIPKPYPQEGVILARILRTIELSEDRQIISSTERDPLTGLYNREYFYRYAEQFDHHHRDLEMDAIIVDVNHFHMINERYGKSYGDEVLRRIGERVREMVLDTGGIVCRRAADTFMVYCPHGKDYQAILNNAAIGLAGDDSVNDRVRLRMGVYANADKSLDIERRFDRAKMAADSVRSSFTRTIGMYDSRLHETELFHEQLIEDFRTAIAERQFQVYFQPKFDIRTEIPVLSSAEALVRWIHPSLGMVSPGVFIGLFEKNGLIQELDQYVWQETAARIRDWKDRLGCSVPVSVNVSRIDMYDPDLPEIFRRILKDSGLLPEDMLLEITESAYTQDSAQIIQVVDQLRSEGFLIEMDDFGTGYSSLNMISTLPIDALKLDMQFIRNAFSQRKDTRMLEVIIDIADYLSVPVIAEGVESEEQLNALKAMGCDLVQGYYFSKPVPAAEFERFLAELREQQAVSARKKKESLLRDPLPRESSFGKIAHALSAGFESIYYVDTENHHYVEFRSEGKYEDLQIERSGSDFFRDTQRNLRRVVWPEDQSRVAAAMRKDALLKQLEENQTCTITYRLVIHGEPEYYSLKAVRAASHDEHHIVIGISNVNEQMLLARENREDIRHDMPEAPVNFRSLAHLLAGDMESIYYVDLDTDDYLEFSAHGDYEHLPMEMTGTRFFLECRENIERVVWEEDREKMLEALNKERLTELLHHHRHFSVVYRLLFPGGPRYYRLKAVLAEHKTDRHIIIGVTDIDEQIREEQQMDRMRVHSVTFAAIARALSRDYFSIYYVNMETDSFIEYSAYGEYQDLGIEKSGEDFFGLSRKNISRVVYQEDREMVTDALAKENMLAELARRRTYTLTYRLLLGGQPTYVHLKATRMEDPEDPHIVIGISNVDEQIRREQEYTRALRLAQDMLNRDPLTGVKSKHAYGEAEEELNRQIKAGEAGPFGIVLCDVNDLKTVNDSCGHAAGDQYLIDACMRICHIFDHSPVYRYGGDEFAVILRGGDYEIREALLKELESCNGEMVHGLPVKVAAGLAEYRPGEDTGVSEIFQRADMAMYEVKKEMKQGAGGTDE